MGRLRNMQALARRYRAAVKGNETQRFYDDLQEGLEKKEILPQEFSLRDLFESFVDDGREIVKSWDPRYGGSGSINLLESGSVVDTSAFSNIFGQISYTQVLEKFNDPSFIGEQLCTIVPTKYNGEKIPGVTRLGDMAESIAEGASYPTAGNSEEWVDSPTTTKRGFIVPVTKEAVFFDNVGMVLERAGEVAYWLGLNREKRILDAALGITTLYRRNGAAAIATYQASTPYINSQSNTLVDWTDIESAELLFDAMTDPNTGELISVVPNTIVVPTALKHTARRILNATETRTAVGGYATSGNLGSFGTPNTLDNYNVITSPLVKARTTSASTWFMGDFKRAFRYMENWPITVVQAPTNSEAEFTNDIVARFKVSERGAAAVYEPRYVCKNT